ncbi:hypothetical protein DDI_3784 [Dickeya dianthicola RNS04.9]|nr:hypothetical protein DDI_3784 [Dickeya dianthicola RNS04.9]
MKVLFADKSHFPEYVRTDIKKQQNTGSHQISDIYKSL